jgi:hypothetical protein
MRYIERLGYGITGIVGMPYNGQMEMAQIPSSKWSFNAVEGAFSEWDDLGRHFHVSRSQTGLR